ncbi:hypothetical protein K1719_014870 [Acacia pycnantha]|nr:hypothetical protein K1719_014870 [Acacia pycnantha]
MAAHNWLSIKDGYGRKTFQSSTKSHSGASLKLHILLQPYIQRTVLNMASAAESIEKVDREIANLNERIRVLEQNTNAMKKFIKEGLAPKIRVLEQNTSAMKEFIKEAIAQGNWPVGNSGRPVTANALGSSVVGAEEKTESHCKEPSDNFKCKMANVLDLQGKKYVKELFSRRKV